jgi:hypothetical protein
MATDLAVGMACGETGACPAMTHLLLVAPALQKRCKSFHGTVQDLQ